jgi:hypothetical protein
MISTKTLPLEGGSLRILLSGISCYQSLLEELSGNNLLK